MKAACCTRRPTSNSKRICGSLKPCDRTDSLRNSMATTGTHRRRYPKMMLGETVSVAIETFRVSKVRFILTSLGMVIGTASLILVVTIGLTGKQYLLQQIQNIGSNMMVAEYQGGGIYGRDVSSDFLTLDDLNAVRQQVPGISNASPMIEYHESLPVPGGKERDV